MASARKKHQEKLKNSAIWLVRWGICDRQSLIFSSGAKVETWPQKCVDAGIALRVPCPAATGFTNLHLFVPTKFAHQIALQNGVALSPLDVRQFNRSARHRILVQRLLIYIDTLKKAQGFELDFSKVKTEREMKFLSEHENTLRLPDCFINLVNSEKEQEVRFALEVETEAKSRTRLEAMAAGVAEILAGAGKNVFGAHGVVFAMMNKDAKERYRKQLREGAKYEHHKRLGQEIKPAGGLGTMPRGVSFVDVNADGFIEPDDNKPK